MEKTCEGCDHHYSKRITEYPCDVCNDDYSEHTSNTCSNKVINAKLDAIMEHLGMHKEESQ